MITMDINTFTSAGALTLSLISLSAAVLLNRSVAQWRSRCLALEASVPALRHEIKLMMSLGVRTSREVQRIEHEYSHVTDRVDLVELRGPAKHLGDAIHSARRGVEPAKLTRQFGLSRGEAELVARLHGQERRA